MRVQPPEVFRPYTYSKTISQSASGAHYVRLVPCRLSYFRLPIRYIRSTLLARQFPEAHLQFLFELRFQQGAEPHALPRKCALCNRTWHFANIISTGSDSSHSIGE